MDTRVIPAEVLDRLAECDKHRGAVWLWYQDGTRYQFRWRGEWVLESRVKRPEWAK